MSKAAVNMCTVLGGHVVSSFPDIHPGVELLGHVLTRFNIQRTTRLFFREASLLPLRQTCFQSDRTGKKVKPQSLCELPIFTEVGCYKALLRL